MTKEHTCRTRFAPSPTGFMHIGNLRSALYAYLLARANQGKFILRIEDTDRARLVEGAVDKIYSSLDICGLHHDEGPDIGGPYGPYVQSARKDHYLPYALDLIERGEAYYCFCEKERLADLAESGQIGYDRHCRDLSPDEVKARLERGDSYVIRQKMPLTGTSEFNDQVFGRIAVDNKELEDQILIKSDGYPTYNFANVIDDHEMHITHVLRGSEYLSSTPKYQQLYRALGWEEPVYVHLPLILGQDGKKLSKRHGATSLEDLLEAGYLPEAIVNYIAFLGWSPGGDTREIFSLKELEQVFSAQHINKAPAVFDYTKLAWVNAQYIAALSEADFISLARPWIAQAYTKVSPENESVLREMLQTRIQAFSEIPEKIAFLENWPDLEVDLFNNKRQKLDPTLCLKVIEEVLSKLGQAEFNWDRDSIHDYLMGLPETMGLKTGQVMGPPRLALAGQKVTPGGAIEILLCLGRTESLRRLDLARSFLAERVAG